MPFQFPLASVLRVRLLQEEREERLLRSIFQEIARTHGSIQRIDGKIAYMAANRMAQVSSAVAARDLCLWTSTVAALYESKRELEKQLERLEQLKDSQLLIYQSARRDREKISDFRAKRLAIYNASLVTREQKTLDDTFNFLRHQTTNL